MRSALYDANILDKPDHVRCRAEVWRQRLQGLIGLSSKEPRTFSLALKQQLHEADPTCQICGQRIHDIDDAEIDHIQHYWRGGRTIQENARLAHRYCNRAHGARN